MERPAGAARPDQYLEFDSADRLVCVSSSASETCDVLRVAYDAAGSRVRETTAEVTRRFAREQVRTYYADGSVEDRAEIFAFGELVAYLHARPVPEVAGGPALLVFDVEVPGWGLALLPVSVLLLGLGLALRGGLLVGVARRPGYAGLSGVLIVSLVVAPYPVAGGGGSANEVVYRWVLADRLGSALTEVDVEGEILRQARFKPFGGLDHEVQLSSPNERRRLYAGHAEQEETGFYYMQARWMDPETGTFLSVDPVVADPSDPQAFNGYRYAANNPISGVDPTGMHDSCFGACVGWTQSGAASWSPRRQAARSGIWARCCEKAPAGIRKIRLDRTFHRCRSWARCSVVLRREDQRQRLLSEQLEGTVRFRPDRIHSGAAARACAPGGRCAAASGTATARCSRSRSSEVEMTTSSALRAAAGILGLFSGLSGGWHAYGAQAIGAPIPTMGLLAFVAILKIAVSVQLALKPGRGVDGVFIFLFGAASIADLDRYLWAPLPSLLITPAAFALGLTLYFRDPQRAASTEAQQR